MNLARFHNILETASVDFGNSEVRDQLDQLVSHLQQLTGEPANPDHQRNVAQSRSALLKTLESSPSNHYPPNWINVLQDYHLSHFLAKNIIAAVNDAFSANAITPQAVLETLQSVQSELMRDREFVKQILSGFDHFGVENEYLSEGDVEISYTVPRRLYEDNPSRLGREFREIEILLKPFAEMAIGHAQEFKVRSISSSDFTIVLGVAGVSVLGAAQVVRLIAAAIRDIISAYKDVVAIRQMKSTLGEIDGAPNERDIVTVALDKFVQAKIDKGMAEATIRLFNAFNKIEDKGRANEIQNHVQISMKKIAARIDHGYEIETRMGELPVAKTEGEDVGEEDIAEDSEIEELREALAIIGAAHHEQLTFEREGEPILSLPDPTDGESAEDDGSNRS